MSWWARFYHDIPNDDITKRLFIADSKYHDKHKYAVIHEDEDSYYIALKPNDINCREVCKFLKKDENHVFYLKYE